MARNYSKVLLLTANVGSIFEDPEKMLPIWLREFLSTITKLEPEFLAIHCQEVGGKNYEESMQHVNKFIKMLLASDEMQPYDRARVFLDEDFTAVEKFTALGSLYFIHQSVKVIEIFDFHEKKFVPVEGKEVLSGNIEHVRIKEKAKFAKDFFPDSVWSRKGFIRTRWNLSHTVFDLVNIHLFHDVSNIAAMETSPSMYSQFRERALLHTVDRFETDEYDKAPFFMFGDFNFRLDTNQLVQFLTSHTEEQRLTGKKNDVSKVVFRQKDNGKVVLTVGKKDFSHCSHNDLFSSHNAMKLKKYDQEPEACRGKLFEYDVTFPPSYPFSEDTEDGTSYMPTRCPGWCDRIMMSHDALSIMIMDNKVLPDYKMIGSHICMGDHKPIYLNLKIRHRSGNDEPRDDTDQVLDSKPTLPLGSASPTNQVPNRQVISINGEKVDAASLENINIHDFTIFEKEEILGNTFMDTIKRRRQLAGAGPSGGAAHKTGRSFKEVARTVLHSENFLEAIKKHYSHRSDSEPDSEDDEKQPAKGFAAATVSLVGVVMAKGDGAPPGNDVAAGSNEEEEDSLNTNMNNSGVSPPDVYVEEASLDFSIARPSNDSQVSEACPQGKGARDGDPTAGGCGSCQSAKGSGAPTDKSLPLSQPTATASPCSRSRARECGCCKVQ